MKSLVIVILLVFAGGAFAEPYDQLEAMYRQALDVPVLKDFESTELDPLSCIFVRSTEKDTLIDFPLIVYERVIKGTPAKGPLFPGTPDRVEKVIIPKHIAETHSEFVKAKVTADDYVVSIDVGLSDAPVSMYFRKSKDGFLTYKLTIYRETKKEKDFYGYCWRGAAAEL